MTRLIAANKHIRCLAAACATSLLTACGHANPAALHTGTAKTSEVVSPAAPQAAAPTDPAAVANARAILTKVGVAKVACKTYSADIYTRVIAPGGKTSWNVSHMNFRSPSTMLAVVTNASDSRVVKTRVLYHGGDDVNLKTFFFGFLAISITLPVNDDRLVDSYKRTLKDSQTSQLMNVLLDPNNRATFLGTNAFKGETVDHLDIVSAKSWSGVSHEVIGISRRTNLPATREIYDQANKLMVKIELNNFKVNPPLTSDDFTL